MLEAGEVAYRGTQPARGARSEPLPAELHPAVAERLASRGVTGLYAHQAETWEAVVRGESVVVSTGTASGKSLAFSLPVLDAVARDPSARAVFLYPTKALAQDQARWLAGLGLSGLRPAIYDGDTPIERRSHIRRTANVILTNPDMLHVGVLPHHDRWGDALHNLRLVVVDEAHVYRGIFGSHVGNVLRRLRRLALAYDADPAFVLASATIANAGELATRLTGLDVPRGRRRHGTAGRARGRALEPRAAGRRPRHARERARRRVPAAGGSRRARPADDLLHEEPQGGRARAPLRKRQARRGNRGAARSLPRRLHAPAASGDRAAARRGRAARGHGDGGARARDRRRLARLRDLRRLSRHRRLAPAAVGPRRPADQRARSARRERGRARPVLRLGARGPARADRRGRADRPRDAARARRARARCGVRGAAHRGGRPDSRAGGPRARLRSSRSWSARPRATSGKDATPRPPACRCARAMPRRS